MAGSKASDPLKLALLGCGTVGSQVARLLTHSTDALAATIGRPIELVGIAVRNLARPRPGLDPKLFTDDAAALVSRDDLDVVIELIGGIDPPAQLVTTAIEHGASVVTANKALLGLHGDEIFAAAEQAGVDLYFEAAVAGAIPIVRPLRESLVGDEISSVTGIVNGTTNFILDKMTSDGADFASALAQAQELGFAEADPTADIEGYDAAAKASLLASLAFHTWVSSDQVYREGITALTPDDINAARMSGCVIKLLALAELTPDGQVSVRVHPAMLPLEHPLVSVNGANNAIFVQARSAGQLMFMGPGAGGKPTASAVIGDLVTVARNRARGVFGPPHAMQRRLPVAAMDDALAHYFLRFHVTDAPGILAQAGEIFARHNVSVRTLQQVSGAGADSAQLGMMTHQCREADLQACLHELATADFVNGEIAMIRVEGM